jgi:hypothetical protein
MKRRASRRFFGGFRKKGRSKSGGGMSPESMLLPAALYGAARVPVANLMAPLTSKIPLGGYSDEAVLGIASYIAAKKGSGMVKKLGMAGLIVEAASVGAGLTSGMLGGSTKGGDSNVIG